jgi:hypothetical protein
MCGSKRRQLPGKEILKPGFRLFVFSIMEICTRRTLCDRILEPVKGQKNSIAWIRDG